MAFSAIAQNSLSSISKTERGDKQKEEDDDDDERRSKAGFLSSPNCCCPCSVPLILGIVAGALAMGVVFATLLSLYLITPAKTANAVAATTGTSTTSTTSTSTTGTTSTTATTSSTSTSSTSSTSTRTTTTATTTSTSTSSTSSTSTTATTTTSSSTTSVTVTTTTSATTTTTTTTTTTKPVCTTRVTFDDIPSQGPTSGVIPNGYSGLNWTNSMYLNASTTSPSGYVTAMKSAEYVGYNPLGAVVSIRSANGTSFSFDSIVISAAWRDNLVWTIQTYRLGVLKVSGNFNMNPINATTISCGACTNMDTIVLSATGGTPHSGLAESGPEFGFDDLCISFGY